MSIPNQEKNKRPDFRRETTEIIKNLKMSDPQLARNLKLSEKTIYNWRKGLRSPRLTEYERLKAFVLAAKSGTATAKSHGEDHGDMTKIVERLLDKIDYLENELREARGEKKSVKQ